MKTDDKKRYFQIALLILAAGSIYTLPYIRTNFQQTFTEVFGLSVEQLSDLYALLGLMFIIGYMPSGWLADKFSSKKLVVFSLFVTGISGIYLGTIPSGEQLFYIFLIWGISTVFTFWSALIKGINLLAKPEEQARVFGLLDGGRGVIEAVMATIALTIFASVVGSSTDVADTTRGLQLVIYFYSGFMLIIGVLIQIFMTGGSGETVKQDKAKLKDFMLIFKSPQVWLMSGVIFTGYTVFWTTYYMGGYIQASYELTATAAATVTTLMLWMRPIGGIGGGILATYVGKERLLMIAMFLGSIALIMFSIFSGLQGFLIIFFVLFIGLMGYLIRGLYWSLLDDCALDPKVLGVAIGFISFVGYLPDIIIPKLTGPIFTKFDDGPEAYVIYFITSAIVGFVGIAVTFIFKKVADKNKKTSNTVTE